MTQDEKLIHLRKLHSTPDRNARVASFALGLTGILLLTAGFLLVITGRAMRDEMMKAATIMVCLSGWLLVALGYPVYGWVAHWQRSRITPEVLQLTEELLM